jgi:hypothetical protein
VRDSDASSSRRRLLAALSTAGLAAFAGCDAVGTPADRDASADEATSTPEPTPPALPYEGERPRTLLDAPRGVRLRNATGESRFVTLALDHDGRQVFLDTREVPPATVVAYGDLVRRRDDYRVVAETGTGARHVRAWTPTPRTGDLLVTLDREVTSRSTAGCDPDCGPAAPAADRVLVLDNPGDAAVPVSLRFGRPGAPDLDRTYDVPAAARVAVGAPGWSADYPIRVDYADRTVRREWRISDGDRLFVTVAGRPRVRCSDTHRELVVVNRVDRERTVDLRIDADGDPAVERSLTVEPTGQRSFQNAVPPAGRYGFRVATDDGIDQSFSTAICPASGPMLVILDESAAVVTIQGAQREQVVDGRGDDGQRQG